MKNMELCHNEGNRRSAFKMVSIFFIRGNVTILSIFVGKKKKINQFSSQGQRNLQRKPCIDRFIFGHQKSNVSKLSILSLLISETSTFFRSY